jgi:hypothetical protein
VRTYPKPSDRIAVEQANGTVLNANSRRIERPFSANALELQAGMARVGIELPVGSACAFLRVRRQSIE